MNENARNNNNEEYTIDLMLMLGLLRKHVILLIVCAIVGGGLAYGVTNYFIPERYRATATVIINNRATDSQYIYPSEIQSSQDLAELYSIIIKADGVLESVKKDLNLNISNEQLKNSIDVGLVGDTQVVEISCTSTNPQYALDLVTKFVEYSKPMILEKVEAGSVKDLNEPSLSNNGNPVSPNKKKNTMVGVLGGAVAAAAFVILREMLNTKFKTEADVTNTLGVPVLGIIPFIEEKEFAQK